ncbi:MAG: hypothetical protein CM1200mP2_21170 [Planctomycetaceae bacterium]|nr:MAG: hypothetical protein CM1200mP2_21170 [Planctomycetaceae bacterium]
METMTRGTEASGWPSTVVNSTSSKRTRRSRSKRQDENSTLIPGVRRSRLARTACSSSRSLWDQTGWTQMAAPPPVINKSPTSPQRVRFHSVRSRVMTWPSDAIRQRQGSTTNIRRGCDIAASRRRRCAARRSTAKGRRPAARSMAAADGSRPRGPPAGTTPVSERLPKSPATRGRTGRHWARA